MYEEMRIRNYSPRSIKTYIGLVSATSKHFGKSPEHISIAELKEYLFHKVEVKKLSASSVNQTISAFKILFKDVLHRTWDPVRIKRPKRPKPLPTVFSKEDSPYPERAQEQKTLLSDCPYLCFRTAPERGDQP